MRSASPWILCLALVACGARMHAGPRHRPAIAITDVTIIDVEHGGSIGPRTVVIDNGRIAAIAAPGDARIPPQAERVDGRGRFLIPGLVDMHVHLFNGSSRRPPNDWSFPLFIAAGVTAVREMNAPVSSIATVTQWRSAVDRGELIAPRIVAAGVAVRGRSPREAADQVHAAFEAGADFIKIYSELPASHWRAVLEAAAARSKAVAGHVPAGVALGVAAAAGQRSNEHLMQAYEACSSNEAPLLAEREGLDGDAAVARRDAQEAQVLEAFDRDRCAQVGAALAVTGQAQVPTLVLPYVESTRGAPPDRDPRWRYLRADERARWERILASVAAHADPQASRRWQVSREIVSAFHRAGVSLLAGTDTPMPGVYPGFSLHDEMALLVEAGLTPLEALQAATIAPARFLGLAAVSGSVAIGKRADLVLLDADPTQDIAGSRRISAVVLDGRLLRRPALDALLEAAAAAQAR